MGSREGCYDGTVGGITGSYDSTTDKKDKEILEAAFMVKTTMERELVFAWGLKLHMEQVY